MSAVGLLLAAGAGVRMGMPKALVRDAAGRAWVVSAARRLRDGGCDEVLVVLGAEAESVRELLGDEPVETVVAESWADGMGASLRRGLDELIRRSRAEAAVVHLVDLPDVGADVVERLVVYASPDVLARASYAGQEHGHPVLLGRAHWAGVAAVASGDRGAQPYLRSRRVTAVDCSDLATGRDVDSAARGDVFDQRRGGD